MPSPRPETPQLCPGRPPHRRSTLTPPTPRQVHQGPLPVAPPGPRAVLRPPPCTRPVLDGPVPPRTTRTRRPARCPCPRHRGARTAYHRPPPGARACATTTPAPSTSDHHRAPTLFLESTTPAPPRRRRHRPPPTRPRRWPNQQIRGQRPRIRPRSRRTGEPTPADALAGPANPAPSSEKTRHPRRTSFVVAARRPPPPRRSGRRRQRRGRRRGRARRRRGGEPPVSPGRDTGGGSCSFLNNYSRLMDSGIATALILSHYPVILKEVNEKFLNSGIDRIKENLQSRVSKGKMTEEKYEETLSLLMGVLGYEKFKSVDLVIEAVVENVKLKQQIFAELERHCSSHCVLATNTSTIDLNLIGEKTNSQDRIIGAHFFTSAHIMPLLEIVRTPRTSLQAVVTLLDVGKKIKKTPIVVGNCTGFAVNHMSFPYTQAALLLVDRGMDVYKIDQACTRFGMPIGPFRLADLVGFGVALATGMQYLKNFPERVYRSMLIPLMIEDKRTGKASEKGFYKYEGKSMANADPEIANYVVESRRMTGAVPDP